MKVLLINKFHYIAGGSESYHFALADMLRGLGHEVIFFAMMDERNVACDQAKFFPANVQYEGKQPLRHQMRAGIRFIYSWEARRCISKLLDQEKPDIAHISLIHHQLTFSVVDELYERNIPIVYTIHDYMCICPNYTMLSHGKICDECVQKHSFLPCLQNRCVKDSLMKSMLSFCEAEFLKLTRRYNRISCYLAPSHIIFEKFQASRFSKAPVMFLRQFLPKDTPYQAEFAHEGFFLFYGRLTPQKGVMTLLRAIEKLPGAVLHIAGEGPQRREAEAFIRERNMEDRVHILGFQQHDDMQEIVRRCKAVIMPSEWYENCPASIYEAQAIGKPVIGSNLGGIPEMIRDGETGYLFNAGDADSLAEAIARLSALTEESYRKMCLDTVGFAQENYGYERYATVLSKVYSGLLSQSKTRKAEETV